MHFHHRYLIGGIVIVAVLLMVAIGWSIQAPAAFPAGTMVTIASGSDLATISQQLQTENVIRSAFWFRLLVQVSVGESGIKAGHYFFEAPLNLVAVVRRVAIGRFVLQPLKVTIPEGLTATSTAKLLARTLPSFDQLQFLTLATPIEGQLFPDTYFFPSFINAPQVAELMQENFQEHTKTLLPQISGSGLSLDQLLTMASLVEREESDSLDRRLVAGILWKRYDAGMLLQVDVAKETYKKLGLPERPIDNPSLDAILAVIYPTESPYWYYLADKHGVTHFAKDYIEHLANVRKYL